MILDILSASILPTIFCVAAAPTSLFINVSLNQKISIPIGICIGLLASFVQSLGLAIQRRSHVLNSQLPEQDQKVEHRRPLWLIGLAIFMTSNVFGSFVQIASLPVVILAPLGAVSLLWNALFAHLLRARMLLGTALIAGGAALIALYGIVPETTRNLDELMALFARPAFIAWFCAEGFFLFVCLVVMHSVESSYQRQLDNTTYLLQANDDSLLSSGSPLISPTAEPVTSPRQSGFAEELAAAGFVSEVTPLLHSKSDCLSPSKSKSILQESRSASLLRVSLSARASFFLALAYAAASGTLSGLCLIFAKSGVELLILTFGGANQFYRWEAWILVGGLVVFALGQLWYLNHGLRLADPSFVCPSAFCFYNFSSIINGLVYFNQLGQLPGRYLILVMIGMFVLLSGVWAISAQASLDESDISTDSDLEEPVVPNCGSTPNLSTHYACHGARTNAINPRLISPPTEVRPEGTVSPESSLSLHTIHVSTPQLLPSSTVHQVNIAVPSLTLSPLPRQRPLSASIHQQQSPSVMAPAGLTIGLSPVSPGFGPFSSPRGSTRRISGTGLGFAAVVNETGSACGRRRTVSMGQERQAQGRGEWSGPHSELSQQDMEVGGGVVGRNRDTNRTGRLGRRLRDLFSWV